MIILRFTSGLGNQLFQYGFYRYLKKTHPGSSVLADTTWYEWNSPHQGFELEKLFLRPDNPDFIFDKASQLQVFKLSGTLPRKGFLRTTVNRISSRFFRRHFEGMHISETGREDEDVVKERVDSLRDGENAYITGYFAREVYFAPLLPELRKAFSFPEDRLGERNRALERELSQTESVSIHVRRGDYLESGYTEAFINLQMDYYRRAVDKACEGLKNPRFYLFSDDKQFIADSFGWLGENKRVVDFNSGGMSWADMYLMSRCRCNITANSTFSVWAGLLNPSPSPRVIYPKEYISEKDSEIIHLPGWYRI